MKTGSKAFLTAVALMSSASAHAQAVGQETNAGTAQGALAPPTSELGEVVITARKTVENLQKAPASVVAVDSGRLLQQGIVEPQALEKVLPSVNLRVQGPVIQTYVRGVGTRSDTPNFANASAMTLNGVVLSRYATFGQIYDLDNIQGIAGPQGTLYGGSAAGGAININTASARNDYSGNATVEYGNYDALQASGAQNIALGEKAAIRGAFNYMRRDSYYGAGIAKQNILSGRLSAYLRPTDNLTAQIFYSFADDTGEPVITAIQNPLVNPKTPYRLPATGTLGNPINSRFTYQNNSSDILSALVTLHVGDASFTYIPGYVSNKADYDFFSGLAGNRLHIYNRERTQSHELRWHQDVGALQLDAGLFYSHNDIDFVNESVRAASATVYTRALTSNAEQADETIALFGQAVYSVQDKLRITAGARISQDKVRADGMGTQSGRPTPFTYRHTEKTPDFKLGVDYDLADRVLVYANFQTGYIRFGYNPDVTPVVEVPTSRLHAYSAGLKSRVFDNRAELNVEAFYYDYKNFQAVAFDTTTSRSIVFGADATVYGVDLSARATLPGDLDLGASLVLLHARYDKFVNAGSQFNGNRMINAPEVNLTAYAQKVFNLGGYELVARADTRYESARYGNYNNFPNTRQPGNMRSDASLELRPEGRAWSVQAFVRNIEDKAVFTTLATGATPAAPASGGLLAPRTYGLRLAVKWD